MKHKNIKTDKKITRKYTCTRRVNKENEKIWVVLEDGRKFYRIFKIRSEAIKYFEGLKTINAEMLIQDLKENIYTSITYTKLAIKANTLKNISLEEFDGGIVEDSDKLFDEAEYIADKKPESSQLYSIEENVPKELVLDFSFVDDMFPKLPPIINPVKLGTPMKTNTQIDKKIISNDLGIVIYQEDLNLSYYVFGEEFVLNREKYVEEKK